MQLNESAQKLDQQLDQVCKKLEKVAFDTSADAGLQELRYYEHFNQQGGGRKYTIRYLVSALINLSHRELQRVHPQFQVEPAQVQHQALSPRAHGPHH